MNRLKHTQSGLSEVRWPNLGKCVGQNGVMYHLGNIEKDHFNEDVIMMNKTIDKSIINFLPYSDRVSLIQFQITIGKMNILQVCGPTFNKSEFYKVPKKKVVHLESTSRQ